MKFFKLTLLLGFIAFVASQQTNLPPTDQHNTAYYSQYNPNSAQLQPFPNQPNQIYPNLPNQPNYNPNQPNYNPNQPNYNPNQPNYNPNQPNYNPNQPNYNPNQPNYNPNQPNYNPNQPNYNPNQPNYNPNQPNYNPNQPNYNPNNYPTTVPTYPTHYPGQPTPHPPNNYPNQNYPQPNNNYPIHIPNNQHHEWGTRGGDVVLYKNDIIATIPSTPTSRQLDLIYPPKGVTPTRTITYIKVTNKYAQQNNGKVQIVSGGVGQKTLNMLFTADPGHGLSFGVEVYGK